MDATLQAAPRSVDTAPAAGDDAGRGAAQAEVLAAAARAFMERGFAATSIDDVAARMGATKGRVYHYHRSKLDLFAAVVRRSLEVIHAEVTAAAEAAGPRAADRLAAMTRAHLTSILRDQPFHRCALQGVEMHHTSAATPDQRAALDGIIGLRDRHQRLFETALAAGIAEGAFRRCDVKPTVLTFLAALNGPVAWYRPRASETEADRAHLIASIAAFALAGLAAPEPETETTTSTRNGRTA